MSRYETFEKLLSSVPYHTRAEVQRTYGKIIQQGVEFSYFLADENESTNMVYIDAYSSTGKRYGYLVTLDKERSNREIGERTEHLLPLKVPLEKREADTDGDDDEYGCP